MSLYLGEQKIRVTAQCQVSIFLSRDLDSRITEREVAAVVEWLQSGQALHVMRDHPGHKVPMLGGTWGARITQADISTEK